MHNITKKKSLISFAVGKKTIRTPISHSKSYSSFYFVYLFFLNIKDDRHASERVDNRWKPRLIVHHQEQERRPQVRERLEILNINTIN